MLNKYEHLSNGLTCILIKSGKKLSSPLLPAFINTTDFETVDKATTESWTYWNAGGSPAIVSNINGKYTKMSRVIMGISEQPRQFVLVANRNPLDLRKENLAVGTKEVISKESFKARLQQLAALLPALPRKDAVEMLTKENRNQEESAANLNPPDTVYIEKNILTGHISFTVKEKKRVLLSLNEQDATALIDIFKDLNVNIG